MSFSLTARATPPEVHVNCCLNVSPSSASRSSDAGDEDKADKGVTQLKVLVVEDDAMQRTIISSLFDRCNDFNARLQFDVTTVSSAAEALHAVHIRRFDLVLLDVIMPHMTGDELLPLLRRSVPSETAVLMASATTKMDIIERCVRSEADAYLPKPLHVEMIGSMWQFCLRRDPSLFFRNRPPMCPSGALSLMGAAPRRNCPLMCPSAVAALSPRLAATGMNDSGEDAWSVGRGSEGGRDRRRDRDRDRDRDQGSTSQVDSSSCSCSPASSELSPGAYSGPCSPPSKPLTPLSTRGVRSTAAAACGFGGPGAPYLPRAKPPPPPPQLPSAPQLPVPRSPSQNDPEPLPPPISLARTAMHACMPTPIAAPANASHSLQPGTLDSFGFQKLESMRRSISTPPECSSSTQPAAAAAPAAPAPAERRGSAPIDQRNSGSFRERRQHADPDDLRARPGPLPAGDESFSTVRSNDGSVSFRNDGVSSDASFSQASFNRFTSGASRGSRGSRESDDSGDGCKQQ